MIVQENSRGTEIKDDVDIEIIECKFAFLSRNDTKQCFLNVAAFLQQQHETNLRKRR